MLDDLNQLLEAPANSLPDWQRLVVAENVLHKRTHSTRVKAYRHLRELYGLDDSPLFGALHLLWSHSEEARPLLALVSACARDPLLRATAPLVLRTALGETLVPDDLAAAVEHEWPGRFRPAVLAKIGRNTISSWRQSGHLEGRNTKVRVRPATAWPATTLACFVAYLFEDARGDAVFRSFWGQLLDTPLDVMRSHMEMAAARGFVEYRRAAGVTQIGFRWMLEQCNDRA